MEPARKEEWGELWRRCGITDSTNIVQLSLTEWFFVEINPFLCVECLEFYFIFCTVLHGAEALVSMHMVHFNNNNNNI